MSMPMDLGKNKNITRSNKLTISIVFIYKQLVHKFEVIRSYI